MEASIQDLELTALTWPEKARALTITDAATYTRAGHELSGIKDLRAQIDQTFNPIIRKAHEAHKEACDKKRTVEGPLVAAEGILKRGMADYVVAEQRRQAEERHRLEAEARKAEEEARLAEAVALAEAGEQELADRVLEEPPMAPPVILPPPAPKVAGIVPRKTWRAQVTDKEALVRAVAAGKVPLAAVDVNASVLGQQVRSLGAELRWPGVRVYEETSIAAGARR